MKETNYWQQFMSTGSISDYLNYRMEYNNNSSGKALGECTGITVRDVGENSYAGVCSGNRDNFKDGACR